jgi:RNA polymerase sigma factor (sigma-70 family)
MTAWESYNSKSTQELIEIFQKKGGTTTIRNKAFFALVHRFRQDLLNKCEVRCKQFGHSANVAEIIAENTFKAYAKKGKFDPNEGKGKTIDDSFKIYLYTIAKNELTNYYRIEEKKRNGKFYDGTEKIITELPKVNLKELDTRARVRYEIISSLTPSQRTVYLTYFAYEKIGCNLPGKLQSELRAHLGDVSQSTIRSYKKEASDKIKEGLRIMDITLNSKP